MATNHIQPGNNLTFTATAAVSSGQFLVSGALFGVALHDAAIGEPVTIKTGGVWALPKVSADEPTQHQAAYWNGTAVTTDADDGGSPATDYVKIGIFLDALSAGSTSAEVRLNSSF